MKNPKLIISLFSAPCYRLAVLQLMEEPKPIPMPISVGADEGERTIGEEGSGTQQDRPSSFIPLPAASSSSMPIGTGRKRNRYEESELFQLELKRKEVERKLRDIESREASLKGLPYVHLGRVSDQIFELLPFASSIFFAWQVAQTPPCRKREARPCGG